MARILVIEDQASLRRLFQSVLTREGHEVVLAQNGEDGVDAAANSMPDLVILDITLPGMTGSQVKEALTESGVLPAVPLIITSALTTIQAQSVAASLSADGVLVKPFDINFMLELVQGLLK